MLWGQTHLKVVAFCAIGTHSRIVADKQYAEIAQKDMQPEVVGPDPVKGANLVSFMTKAFLHQCVETVIRVSFHMDLWNPAFHARRVVITTVA